MVNERHSNYTHTLTRSQHSTALSALFHMRTTSSSSSVAFPLVLFACFDRLYVQPCKHHIGKGIHIWPTHSTHNHMDTPFKLRFWSTHWMLLVCATHYYPFRSHHTSNACSSPLTHTRSHTDTQCALPNKLECLENYSRKNEKKALNRRIGINVTVCVRELVCIHRCVSRMWTFGCPCVCMCMCCFGALTNAYSRYKMFHIV